MPTLLDVNDDDLELKLLQAGRDVVMSAELKERTLLAAGVAGTGLTVATVSEVGRLGWLSGKAWPFALGTTGVVGLAALTFIAQTSAIELQEPPVAPAVLTASPPQGSTQIEAPPTTDSEGSLALDRKAQSAQQAVTSPPITAETPRKAATRPAEQTPVRKGTLKEEISVLSGASAALSHNPQLALERIADYRRRFPHPKLGLEAEVLSIQARAQSGQVESAQHRAKSFAKRHPKSPLLARLKKYL